MDPSRKKKIVLPQAHTFHGYGPPEPPEAPERPGVHPCPCCGCRTFPVPPENATAYICPVCMWENDVFTASDDEPSDENHGLTLRQARENVRLHGVCDPRLIRYARPPRPSELPESGNLSAPDSRPL